MVIKVGTAVGTEFGEGIVVAITKEWVVVQTNSDGLEVALHREDSPVCVAVTGYEIGGGQGLTIEVEPYSEDDG